MSYDSELLKPLETDYLGQYTENSIDQIAQAWSHFQCAHVENANPHPDARGYYLTCGHPQICNYSNFGYHIHLFYDGFVSLKEKVHTKKDTITNIITDINWWYYNQQQPNAYQVASFLYLWAGYNSNENCIKLNFN